MEGESGIGVEVTLKNVLYVPKFDTNLVSSIVAADNSIETTYTCHGCLLRTEGEGKLIETAERTPGLYCLRAEILVPTENTYLVKAKNIKAKAETMEVWHRRLGHTNPKRIVKLAKAYPQHIRLSSKIMEPCQSCILGKIKRKAVSITPRAKAKKPFQDVYSDFWGPAQIASVNGAYYYMSLIDECTSSVWFYFSATKTGLASRYKNWHKYIRSHYGKDVVNFHSDCGGKYVGIKFEAVLAKCGVAHHKSSPHTLEHNEIAEKKNQDVMAIARTALIKSGLPKKFWAEAVNYAVQVINILPTTAASGQVPYELLEHKSPDYRRFH